MEYGIKQLSELAGVSARTLRYYDQIGLLKPLFTAESGYRYYGAMELERLQQILFYRERGFALKKIADLLDRENFDLLETLEEHLTALEAQRDRLDQLAAAVRKTIAATKGEKMMSDQERFAAFKKKAVEENEERYGRELREKYGEETIDRSNRRMLNMTAEEYAHFKMLEKEILDRLEQAVLAGESTEGEEARQIAFLHKEWLSMTWAEYTTDAHRGMVELYVQDERFTRYYDREVPGCAEFLKGAVLFFFPIL